MAAALRSFAATERFLAQLGTAEMRPGYVLAGDETFLLDRCRAGVLQKLLPENARDFALHDLDLATTTVFELLNQAQTPSLMAPFQVFFVRGLKSLYTRGAKKPEFDALEAYFRMPNPQALIVFLADYLHLPTDLRRMEMQDKERFERLRETLGEWCGMVELQRVDEADGARWLEDHAPGRGVCIEGNAVRELVDALGADMLLVATEFEKLALYAQGKLLQLGPAAADAIATITLGDVETMVLAARQRSLYELTDAISRRDRVAALALLDGLLNASDGGEDSAIGHLYMLARTFRQMLIIVEKNVRDSRAIWSVLWHGFRMPPFAAEDLIRQARRYKTRGDLTRALRLIARADIAIRSSPPDKRLVLERLVLALAAPPETTAATRTEQFAMEL